jgi:Xaa-Pro aminopeptidase
MLERLTRLRQKLQHHKVDGLLISKGENIRYLSGFSGGRDARLLVSADRQLICTDSRYFEQTARESPHWELVEVRGGDFSVLATVFENLGRLGVEAHDLSYREFRELENILTPELVPLDGPVEELRLVKDEEELAILRQAAAAGDRVFSALQEDIRPAVSEQWLAARISYLLRLEGCERESFDTIAVAGPNAALPHGRPGKRLLARGDMLTLDFGGVLKGYCSDMTRTVLVGEASGLVRDRYNRLLEAQQLGVAMVREGAEGREVDAAVRAELARHDLDIFFQHSTGHGVGLEVHEQPALSPRSQAVLRENMVVTVEPGIYIPGWGGIRIEDTVIVKKGGCEIITHSDRGLLIY